MYDLGLKKGNKLFRKCDGLDFWNLSNSFCQIDAVWNRRFDYVIGKLLRLARVGWIDCDLFPTILDDESFVS